MKDDDATTTRQVGGHGLSGRPLAILAYRAPGSGFVYLGTQPGEDLTVGFRIVEMVPGRDNGHIICEGVGTLRASHLESDDFNRHYWSPELEYREGVNRCVLRGDCCHLYFKPYWIRRPRGP